MKRILAKVLGVSVLLGGMTTLAGCGGDNEPKKPPVDLMKDMTPGKPLPGTAPPATNDLMKNMRPGKAPPAARPKDSN